MLSLMHGVSLNTLPLMNIFIMLQGAGVKCVCVKEVRGKPCARHQTKNFFIKIVEHLHQFLHINTFSTESFI